MARFLLLFLTLSGVQAIAADRWIRVTSAHFELYTPGSEKRGRETVVFFEKLLDFFIKNVHLKESSDRKIRVVLFKGEKDYAPFKMNEFADAYYVPGYSDDYIILHSTGSDHLQTLVHEFTHLVVHHSGLELPPWLNEGLAELYATFKPVGDKIQVGDLQIGRMQVLHDNKWLDLATLLRVDHKSPYYNESKRASIFYAEAWALTHMLQLEDSYRPKTQVMIVELLRGATPEDAFQKAYGKSLADVQKDLMRYINGNQFKAVLFPYKMPKQAEESESADLSDVEAEVLQCRVLQFAHKMDQAEARLTALAKANPKDWRPEAELGELAWHNHKISESSPHFARAAGLGASDPTMYFDYAMSLRGNDKDAAEALRTAVKLKPDYGEAHYRLAFVLMRLRQYGQAMVEFSQVKHIKEDEAFYFFSGRAHAQVQLGRYDAAIQEIASARKYAKEPSDKLDMDRLSAYIEEAKKPKSVPRPTERAAASRPGDEDEKPRLMRREEQSERKPPTPLYVPPPTVEGDLTEVDCGQGKLTMMITTGGQARRFTIPNPEKIALKGHDSGTIEFTCGKQKPRHVVVELGEAGEVKVIEFK